MRKLVVCREDFHLHYEKVLSCGSMILNEEKISYALIEHEDVFFDPEVHVNGVLVRKHAFSCNYRDISLILMASNKVKHKKGLSYFTIGSEFSGVIENIGRNVKRFNKGDRVVSDAFYPYVPGKDALPGLPSNHASAELEIISEHKLMLMPPEMPFPVAAAFTIGAQTVYSMIEKLNIQQNDRVLITGIKSNTSLFAINALKRKKVEICGLSRSRVDEEFFRDLGLKHIFYAENEFSNLLEYEDIIKYILEKGKFNCVIDPFSDSYLFRILDLLEMNGKYITCGLSNQTVFKHTPIDLTVQFNKLILNNITIIGNCLGSSEVLGNALDDYAKGRLDVIIADVIDADVDCFMKRTFLGKEKLGKVVFKYN